MSSRRRRRVAANGRNLDGASRFTQFQRAFLHSAQFSALTVTSRALVVELQTMFNGTNNGTLFLSVRDGADRLGLVDLKAVRKAFDELIGLGLITEAIGATFSIKADTVSRARGWQLNWLMKGGLENLPPVDCAKLTKKQNARLASRSRVLKRYLRHYSDGEFAVEKSTTVHARIAYSRHLSGEENTTS